MFRVELYKAPLLVYVRDEEDKDLPEHIQALDWMKRSYQEISNTWSHEDEKQRMGRVFYKYANKKDLKGVFGDSFNNTPTPFVFITEVDQITNKPYYHIYPGKNCIHDQIKMEPVQSYQNFTNFVKRLYSGSMYPELKNHNLTEFYENITIAEGF